jgi:hypothetical protein
MSCEILDTVRAAKKNWKLACPKVCGAETDCPLINDDQVFPPTEIPPISKNVFVLKNLQEGEPGLVK